MTNLAIAANGLRKSYGDKVVLDGIDLAVPEGTIFSLLGPNGAGKTTTVQILSTLIPADGGTVQVAGHDLARNPTTCAARSASPASTRPSTSCSPARRTCSSWPTCKHLSRRRRQAQGRGTARPLRPGRRGAQTGRHLLRRHATPARPGDDPGRRPPPDLPGRAHHRPRPAQPPLHVADRPRTRRRAASPSSSPPSTWRRPTSSPTASPSSTTDG